jgi:hypothetical protein
MPLFKTTYNILGPRDQDELFDRNQLDRSTPWLPPSSDWDYAREMQIEDVDVWEILYEAGQGIGVYAAYSPFAEFYMVTTGWLPLLQGQRYNDKIIETYYGAGAQNKVYKRAKELGIDLSLYKSWVDDDEMWLYNGS